MKPGKNYDNLIEFMGNKSSEANSTTESYMLSQIDLLNTSYMSLKERYYKYFKAVMKDKTNNTYEIYHKSPAKLFHKISPKKIKSESAPQSFEQSIHIFAEEICGLWSEFLKCIKDNPKLIIGQMDKEVAATECKLWNTLIRENELKCESIATPWCKNVAEYYSKEVSNIRSSVLSKAPFQACIDKDLYDHYSALPLLFAEHYNNHKIELPNFKGTLIVFVHGLQGSSYDLRWIRNILCEVITNAKFLCSSSNEATTQFDIQEMGMNLCNEVITFVKREYPKEGPANIAFIGHSLGGLIIRAALPFLSDYKSKMSLFMTVGTPHLGLEYNSSSLVSTGVWFLNKFNSTQSLLQMSLRDNPKFENSYLYRLSTYEGLDWFKNVVLVCSEDDGFVPYESARIEISSKASQATE
jgi:Putative serine esterase (DUF676)